MRVVIQVLLLALDLHHLVLLLLGKVHLFLALHLLRQLNFGRHWLLHEVLVGQLAGCCSLGHLVMHDESTLFLSLQRVVGLPGLPNYHLSRLLSKSALRIVLPHSFDLHFLVNVVTRDSSCL